MGEKKEDVKSRKHPVLRGIKLVPFDPLEILREDYPEWLDSSPHRSTLQDLIADLQTVQVPAIVPAALQMFDLHKLEQLLMQASQPSWKRLLSGWRASVT